MDPLVPLRVLRRSRQGQGQAERGAESKNGESRSHGRLSLFACRTATSPNSVQSCASNAAQLGRSRGGAEPGTAGHGGLALAGLEAPLRLVDDVDPPLAPHDAVVAVPAAERFQ